MNRLLSAALALSLGLALSGCGEDRKAAGAGTAEGEVLPGSASDAMLPLDTVKSQAPLAPKSESSGKTETKDEAKPATSARTEAAAPDPEAAPPAEEAAAE